MRTTFLNSEADIPGEEGVIYVRIQTSALSPSDRS